MTASFSYKIYGMARLHSENAYLRSHRKKIDLFEIEIIHNKFLNDF